MLATIRGCFFAPCSDKFIGTDELSAEQKVEQKENLSKGYGKLLYINLGQKDTTMTQGQTSRTLG